MFASILNKGQEAVDYWLGQPATPQRTFGSGTTAHEIAVLNEPNIRGRVFLVTGCTHGMGKETARQLARRGGIVLLASREPKLVSATAAEILADCPEATLHQLHLNLADLSSVKACAKAVKALGLPGVHVLINNAGVAFTPWELTVDGQELQWQSNYLGHYLLALLLLPDLMSAAAHPSAKGLKSRIVNVASTLHHTAYMPEGIRLSDLTQEKYYNPVAAYGQSKLALLLFTQELSKRLQTLPKGGLVSVNALHPGAINSGITRHFTLSWVSVPAYVLYATLLGKSVEQGAGVEVFCGTSGELEGVTGAYLSSDGAFASFYHPSLSRDPSLGLKLWSVSASLTGLDLPTSSSLAPPLSSSPIPTPTGPAFGTTNPYTKSSGSGSRPENNDEDILYT